MKIYFSLISFILILILTGCASDVLENDFNERDIKQLTRSDEALEFSMNTTLLDKSDEIAESSISFNLAKGFIPDEEYKNTMNVQGEEVLYLHTSKDHSQLTGEIIVENMQEEKVEFQTLFLQGNKVAKIRTSDEDEWNPSVRYEVPANSTVNLSIEIDWDINGMQELIFLPIEKTEENLYGNANLSNFRFFVQNKDINIGQKLLDEQTFQLEKNMQFEDINFYPSPSWYGENKDEMIFREEDNQLYSEKPVEGLVLDAIPYSTSVDVLYIDEYGNSSLIEEDIKIKKNEKTFISIESKLLEEMYSHSGRQFFMVLNNREEKILADLRTLDKKRKPFMTSYQGVLEFYQKYEE